MKKKQTATADYREPNYDGFLARVNTRFLENIKSGSVPLFTTDASNLWALYLGHFPEAGERQYHNCHACRHFIERFGGLATISGDGTLASAMWNAEDAPDAYKNAVTAMAKAVRRAKVTGVFVSSEIMWGTPTTGVWNHFYACPPTAIRHDSVTKTAGQLMAEKLEDFKTVTRALLEFNVSHVGVAMALLDSDQLYRSEKCLGQAKWLFRLHEAVNAANTGKRKENVIWHHVAMAPAGFCHPRTSMIGTLLEDIAAGKSFAEIEKAFAAKMHPLAYQRPQAAPTVGTIEAAEKVMKQLGAAGSLARRFCRLDEVTALWWPTAKKDEPQTEGVFSHLKPKAKAVHVEAPAQTMTFEKFRRVVLPTAERIRFMAPSQGSYTALVTAVNADAPPILQWDNIGARNPVSNYFWTGGATAESFGLEGGRYFDVEAIALKPSMWNGGNEHHGTGVVFILEGARETRQAGCALFPETLKSEFHAIRSVIEAYSKSSKIEGMNEPHAAGVMVCGGRPWDVRLRVWSGGFSTDYKLDRWD